MRSCCRCGGIHRHVGMGGDQLVEALAGEAVERENGDALRTAHDVLYLASIQSVSVFDGARDLIVELKQRGQQVVLASSAKVQEAEHYLNLLDAREIVDAWTTSDDVEQTKPSPDLVSAALGKLGTETGVMLGDTPWDIEAAGKLDVPTIAVLTGGFSEAELRDAGAIAVFESVQQLRARIDETPLSTG
jgi:HAD superfamily hydrolase (TIGR01549 family)